MFDIWKEQMNETDAFLLAARCGQRGLDYSHVLRLGEPSSGGSPIPNKTLFYIIEKAFKAGMSYRDKEITEKVPCSSCGTLSWPNWLDEAGECQVCALLFSQGV